MLKHIVLAAIFLQSTSLLFAPITQMPNIVEVELESSYDFSVFHGVMRERNAMVEEEWYWYSMIPKRYREVVKGLHEELGIPYDIMYRLVWEESRWKHWAVNRSNTNGTYDIGLCQLNSQYHTYFVRKFWNRKPIRIDDPVVNLTIGMRYLSWLHNYYDGDWKKAVMAYNTGYGNVNADRIPARTKLYAERIVW